MEIVLLLAFPFGFASTFRCERHSKYTGKIYFSLCPPFSNRKKMWKWKWGKKYV